MLMLQQLIQHWQPPKKRVQNSNQWLMSNNGRRRAVDGKHQSNAYQFLQLNLPQSAAMEEIKATRAANRLILELEAELKQQQQLEKKSTNRK